jgi:hypothetical protein
MISLGVPAGASSPIEPVTVRPGKHSLDPKRKWGALLFEHLVGAGEQRCRHVEAMRPV